MNNGALQLNSIKECLDRTYHVIGFIVAPYSAASFTRVREFHVPWKWVLSETVLSRFLSFSGLCTNMLSHVDARSNRAGVYEVHCHCDDPKSLQCAAGGRVIMSTLTKFVAGAAFNQMFPFYRSIANESVSSYVIYEGSVYYQKVHYIYISTLPWQQTGDRLIEILRETGRDYNLYVGEYWFILRCFSCDLTEHAAKKCAFRTNAFLMRCAKLLGTRLSYCTPRSERRLARELRRETRQGFCCCDTKYLDHAI